ncbi:rhamnan synthesis F family protein [Succinivibrio dextrinosolvens]|uniref:Rhamnan synthesis protein F n=1 Tax=Succinivibrio dextrinosolvens TaxID=83771 RepID=A0A662ZDP8_9GAMM|nr:rhamnan synthesis F family protein [Succinivibrio dextrinosolvens]SFK44613.1 Rhamnan synthesis protein F [Succinivibrio dextrinosolvens]
MKNFLIIIHLYYTEQWKKFCNYLNNIDVKKYTYDLYVSLPKDKSYFSCDVLSSFPNANITLTENVGYDVWPFFKVINQVNLDEYEFVIKLHSKRNMGAITAVINRRFVLKGNDWRNLLVSFISSKSHFEKAIASFRKRPNLGMINSFKLFDTSNEFEDVYHRLFCFNEAKKEIERIGLEPTPSREVTYIAGTMFICRACLFKVLKKMNYCATDFIKANRNNENDLAHIMERVFGWLVTSQNYYIDDPYSFKKFSLRDYYRYEMFYYNDKSVLGRFFRYCRKIRRFIFRIDVFDEKKIIKIFKIPVYKQK